MTVAFGNGIKQVREPDKDLMAVALNEIKGSYRSMADLAKESGISPATLSRIANGNFDRPLSYHVLYSLAKCAPEGCKYNLDALLEINGMRAVSVEERNGMAHGLDAKENKSNKPRIRTQQEIIEISARTSLAMELQKISDNSFAVESDESFTKTGFIANMSYKTSGMALTSSIMGNCKWVFAVFNSFDPTMLGISPELKAKSFMEKLSYVYLQDAWNPESLRDYKFSAVFDEENTYAAFVKLLESKEFHNRFSAVLINPYEFIVVREHVFKSKIYPSETRVLGARGGVMGN